MIWRIMQPATKKGSASYEEVRIRKRGGARRSDPRNQQDAEDAGREVPSAGLLVHQRQMGEQSMTNIEKLARLIVKTGRADQIMRALEIGILLKVEVEGDHVGSDGTQLRVRQISAGGDPSSLHQQAG